MIRSALSSPLRSALSSAFAVRRGGGAPAPAFDPATLFGVNDRGGIYDMTSSANLFQLSGGTGSVAVGDPVGYVADLGPIVRPALQATAASRPVWAGVPRTLGSELVVNGRFATDTDWTKGTGWTINTTTGRAEKVAGTASVLSIPITVTAGKFYFLPFYITRTAGTVTARLTGGTTVAGTARSYGGSYIEIFQAVTGNVTLEMSADATFAGSVGNVSLKEVTTFTNYGVKLDGTDDALQTANVDLSNSDKMTLVVGFQSGQSVAAQVPLAFGNYPASLAGSGELILNGAWQARLRGATGSAISGAPAEDAPYASNYQSNVQVAEFDLAGAAIADQTKIGLRGVFPTNTPSGALSGGGVLANSAITIGRAFSSFRLNGIVTRALVINRALTGPELDDVRAWAGAGMVVAAVLGDSTVSHLSSAQALPQAMKISSLVGGLIVNGGDTAKSGDRIADQLTAWNNLTDKTALKAVIVQIGLNDVRGRVGQNLATSAQVITDYQNLIDTINGAKPSGCRVYVSGLTPCKTWLDGTTNPTAAYAAWQDLNTAIAGGGATPITGVDGRITSHVAALSGAGDTLDAKYNMDDVHENNEARFIIAQAWRTALEAGGLL
jgi:hypothetical protein